MTTREKKMAWTTVKWLLTMAFLAGGIVYMVKGNSKSITLQAAVIEKHDTRIRCVEKDTTSLQAVQEATHEDVKWIKNHLINGGHE